MLHAYTVVLLTIRVERERWVCEWLMMIACFSFAVMMVIKWSPSIINLTLLEIFL
jgi:hypothetical protein